jgi:hypothetical protein
MYLLLQSAIVHEVSPVPCSKDLGYERWMQNEESNASGGFKNNCQEINAASRQLMRVKVPAGSWWKALCRLGGRVETMHHHHH